MAAKRKNLKKKIVSLSALGAGAIVFGAGEARAGVIYSGPVNSHVGYGAGGLDQYVSPLLGPNNVYFSFFHAPIGPYGRFIIGYGPLQFATNGSLIMRLFGPGAVWTPWMTGYKTGVVGGRLSMHFPATTSSPPISFAFSFGNPPFSEKFSLFRFLAGPGPFYNYGWIRLSYTVDPQMGANPAFGPDLYIRDWAYDDSGHLLAAGTVPEPGNLIPTGLAALALGATGLRRWRKNRKAA